MPKAMRSWVSVVKCGLQTSRRESVQDDGGCETDSGSPECHPNPGARKMPSIRTADDDAKEPCATSIDGACENRAESSNSQEDHDRDGGADAARQENGTYVPTSYTEDQHVGESEGDAETCRTSLT